MDLKLISNMAIESNALDYPDFADACVTSADYDGIPMNEDQLNTFNEEHSEYIHEKVLELYHY